MNEKQDEVREILFRTREIVRESTPEGRFLLVVFVDMADLFEQIMSTYYNYKELHEQFDSTGILPHYEIIINKIAESLDEIAFALKTGGLPHISSDLIKDVNELKEEITLLESNSDGKYNTLGLIALKNIEDATDVRKFTRNVDVDDDYVVRVLIPRSAARRKESANFSLKVTIN